LLRGQARLASQQVLADVRRDMAPTLTSARRVLRGALVVSGVVGLGLLIYLPLARRRK
jgi:hypothetical protein